MRDSYIGFAVRARTYVITSVAIAPCRRVRLEMWSRDPGMIHRVDLRSGIATFE